MKTADFSYNLPPELIAQHPAPERTQARLLVLGRTTGRIDHCTVADLPDLLAPHDLLVVNDTRVFPARLFGRKADSGGTVEVLLIEATAPDTWEALMRVSRAPRVGAWLDLAGGRIRAEVLDYPDNGRVRLRLKHAGVLLEILEQTGATPLPPYIKRPRLTGRSTQEDRERYQTIFAHETGAVAAPTAGLHFTPALLAALESRGIRHAAVTLHVGPGTFKPVTAADTDDHVMEAERYLIPPATADAIAATRERGGRVVTVGSTVVRTLETVAAEKGRVMTAEGRSAMFIRPGHRFLVVDALLTNFHLPCSTLLMMVCAFAGQEPVMAAYQEAIRKRYRFYSYGDAMLIKDEG